MTSIPMLDGIHYRLLQMLRLLPTDPNIKIPRFGKHESLPYMNQPSLHFWILIHAIFPCLIHQVWVMTRAASPGPWHLAFLYVGAWNLTFIHQVHALRRLSHQVGFFDSGNQLKRTDVPKSMASRITASVLKTTVTRVAMTVWLCDPTSQAPFTVLASFWFWSRLLPILSAYCIILDFWFYWYHRLMHEIPYLWKFHRLHHVAKYPNALMSGFAEAEQELFDMIIIPIATYITFRCVGVTLGFHEWWICHQYVTFTEVWGHCGLRVHFVPPSPITWLLQMFELDGGIEDHDLHHRYGHRQSSNYSKQTRLWDTIFGTSRGRIESVHNNIDYINQICLNLFK